MSTRLRLVKEDGTLASVRDLFEMKEMVALGGNVVAFTAIGVSDDLAYSWRANTPEQREARAVEAELHAARILDDAAKSLAQLQEDAVAAIGRIANESRLNISRR